MGLDSTPDARPHARGGRVVVCAVGFLARCAGRRGADGAAYPMFPPPDHPSTAADATGSGAAGSWQTASGLCPSGPMTKAA